MILIIFVTLLSFKTATFAPNYTIDIKIINVVRPENLTICINVYDEIK